MEQAIEIAMGNIKEYKETHGLAKLFETDDCWVTGYARFDGLLEAGALFDDITINKETGEVKPYHLPSDEGFEILEKQRLVKSFWEPEKPKSEPKQYIPKRFVE